MKAELKNKMWLFVMIGIVLAFILYNLFWLCWRNIRYNGYTKNLKTFRKHYSYVLTADDGYLFNVKLPDYLSFTGNLCVATPDDKIALIIWPNVFKDYHYGVQVEKDGEVYSIEVNEKLESKKTEYNDLIDENKNTIQLLREKAADMWEASER
ncbi:MAG: hypothetical protein K5705_00335 [Oscillospiraceae bacterium]|nr:hypothetical protein [Oscillospiraceae bacterium]